MIAVALQTMRRYEADGRKPPGYVARVLPLAAKVDDAHAYFEPEVYRRLAEESADADALAYIGRHVTPRVKGVGDHLHDIIVEWFGAQPDRDCGCNDMIQKMNVWGPDGCREHRQEIIDKLMEQKTRLSVWLRAAISVAGAIARAVCGEMLDEAIRRCESDHLARAGKMIVEEAR